MTLQMNNILPWALMFLLTFVFSVIVHKRFKERNVWNNIVRRYRENTDKKLLSETEFVTRFGAIENNSILYKLDRLVLTSGIKNYLPWVSGEVMLLGMIMAGMAGLSAREDRKNILFSSKLTLVVISIMQIIIVWIIGAGLGIDVKHIMTSNAFGQVLLMVTGLLYLMVGVKMFGTDR